MSPIENLNVFIRANASLKPANTYFFVCVRTGRKLGWKKINARFLFCKLPQIGHLQTINGAVRGVRVWCRRLKSII